MLFLASAFFDHFSVWLRAPSDSCKQIARIHTIFYKMFALAVFALLAFVKAVDGAEVTHNTCPYFCLSVTMWTFWLLSIQVSMRIADRKNRRYRHIRKLIRPQHLFNKPFAGFGAGELFVHVKMQNRTARIFALQAVLQLQRLKRIVRMIDRDLGGVGIVNIFP